MGFAPLDDTGTQLLFRFVAAAYERHALGIGSHWPFDQWGRVLSERVRAASPVAGPGSLMAHRKYPDCGGTSKGVLAAGTSPLFGDCLMAFTDTTTIRAAYSGDVLKRR